MNIGLVAKQTNIPAKTIRYYEEIGLITADRKDNGYRDYSDAQVAALTFLARARSLGFTINECRSLLSLYADPARASADVRAITLQHLTAVDQKIIELNAMRTTLAELVTACQGGDRPDCPILADLAGQTSQRGQS